MALAGHNHLRLLSWLDKVGEMNIPLGATCQNNQPLLWQVLSLIFPGGGLNTVQRSRSFPEMTSLGPKQDLKKLIGHGRGSIQFLSLYPKHFLRFPFVDQKRYSFCHDSFNGCPR